MARERAFCRRLKPKATAVRAKRCDPTIADGILDRPLHSAIASKMRDESMPETQSAHDEKKE
jgi:hypothetical protein